MSADNVLTAGRQQAGRQGNSLPLVLSKPHITRQKRPPRHRETVLPVAFFGRVSQRLFGAKCGAAAEKEEGYP